MTLPFIERTTGFRWNERLQRYQGARGQIVSMATVRDGLDQVIAGAGSRLRALSESLNAGSISLADWQTRMAQEIKLLHVASTSAARGGWAQMSQSDWGWVGQRIRTQYQFLNNFAAQIGDGTQQLDGRLLVRTDLYAQAARGSYEEFRRRHLANTREVVGERRVLGVADHCSTAGGLEGCLELAAKGVQPPGTLPPIGQSPCRGNCKCTFVMVLLDGTEIR